jgi:hypothetical protein
MQYFKENDDTEKKYEASAAPVLDDLALQKNLMFADAYSAAPLGEVIYDALRAPLAKAIKRDIFRSAFAEIFSAFVVAGSFESYLTVFRKIFGETVDIVFAVPAPGKLTITITADEMELTNALTRYIANNMYVLEPLVDYDGDNILFQTVKGFQSQYELEQMLFEMVPGGIYTLITLTIGGA